MSQNNPNPLRLPGNGSSGEFGSTPIGLLETFAYG